MSNITYPTVEGVIAINSLVLTKIKVKKADKPEVLSKSRISELLDALKGKDGTIYDKAVVLLKGLIQKHPFASGNRRTAFVVTNTFIIENNAIFGIKDTPEVAKVMIGIREDYYTDNEIREWIQHGSIRKFERFK